MNNKILELEKSLFKIEYMNDEMYLNSIIDDDYIEIGKSGMIYDKKIVVEDLLNQKENRNIEIYNYSCKEINKNIYLVHYITLNNDNKIYRTSIWKKEDNYKILFHQASILKEDISLIKN